MLDPVLKGIPAIRYSALPCLIAGLSILVIGFILYGFGLNKLFFICILFMALCLGLSLFILGTCVLIYNHSSYKNGKYSLGLNRYANNTNDKGLLNYLFNQFVAISYAAMGFGLIVFIVYAFYNIITGDVKLDKIQ